MSRTIILYGAPVGLYTGKIRSYLRKQGIAYVERLPTDPVFRRQILPAVQRFINPVILTADGRIVQDTADIIDFLEAEGYARGSATPERPLQKLIALILDLFGGEGLVRPAMHYRWSFREEQEAFLRHEFGLSYRPGKLSTNQVEEQLDQFMSYLNAYIEKFGINAQTRPAIEGAYEDLLTRLDAHFRAHPYALGGVPTLADYGLMAPLYAHLARDPVPASLMKLKGPSLYRWTERMNACDADVPEFPRYPQQLADDDTVPDTLLPVFEWIARDWLPELKMIVESVDAWLAAHPDKAAPGDTIERSLTESSFTLRGQAITTIVQPYALYKLQRVTDAYHKLDAPNQDRVAGFLKHTGLSPLLTLRASRRIERRNHLEVWGPAP